MPAFYQINNTFYLYIFFILLVFVYFSFLLLYIFKKSVLVADWLKKNQAL